jgi:hypothetical protein
VTRAATPCASTSASASQSRLTPAPDTLQQLGRVSPVVGGGEVVNGPLQPLDRLSSDVTRAHAAREFERLDLVVRSRGANAHLARVHGVEQLRFGHLEHGAVEHSVSAARDVLAGLVTADHAAHVLQLRHVPPVAVAGGIPERLGERLHGHVAPQTLGAQTCANAFLVG